MDADEKRSTTTGTLGAESTELWLRWLRQSLRIGFLKTRPRHLNSIRLGMYPDLLEMGAI